MKLIAVAGTVDPLPLRLQVLLEHAVVANDPKKRDSGVVPVALPLGVAIAPLAECPAHGPVVEDSAGDFPSLLMEQ